MLDDLDIKILQMLLQNSRMTYKTIAKRCGTSVSTVHNRIKRLKGLGVIGCFIPEIDARKLGFNICVFINLRIEGGHFKEIQENYSTHKNVCSMYDITGEYDTTIVAKFKNTKDLNDFIKKITAEKYVIRTSTQLVLEIIKESFSPSPEDIISPQVSKESN